MILVIAAGHVAVARYDVMAYGLVNCVFNDEGGEDCGNATDPPTARDRRGRRTAPIRQRHGIQPRARPP